MVGGVGAEQGVRRVTGGGPDLGACELLRVEGGVAEVRGGVGCVVGAPAQDDGEFPAPGEADVRPFDGDAAAGAVRRDRGPVSQSVREGGAEGDRGLLAVGSLQRDGAGVAASSALAEVQDDDVVGPAGEDLASVGHAGADVRRLVHALGEVEGAAVAGDGGQVVVGDVDGEPGQQGEGAEVLAAVGELAVGVEGVVEAAGPQGGVGDEKEFAAGVVAREGAEAAVADGQALFDHRVFVGGSLPPEPVAWVGVGGGCIGGSLGCRGRGEGGQRGECGGQREDTASGRGGGHGGSWWLGQDFGTSIRSMSGA